MNTKGRRKVGILAQGAVCHYCALSTMKMFSVQPNMTTQRETWQVCGAAYHCQFHPASDLMIVSYAMFT